LAEGPKGCTSRTISEEDLHAAVAEAFNQVLGSGESMISVLRGNIESVVCESNEQAIANIDKVMEEKQMELIRYANSGKDYESLADEIQELSERKQAILTDEAENQGKKERITEMMEFIENHADQSLDYDEELVRLLVKKVTIFENNVVVRFKSGIEVEV
jgi:gamma-glutamylcysteine synthetase